MVLLSAKSTNYTLYTLSAVGCRRVSPGSGMWAHCSSQMSQMGMQILFEQLCINMVMEKKNLPIFFLSGENSHAVILLPWPLSLLLEAPCLLLLPSYLLIDFCPLSLPTCMLSSFPLTSHFHFHRLCEFSLKCRSQQKPFMAGSSEPSQ